MSFQKSVIVYCYELNVCGPPKMHLLKTDVMVWRQGLWEVFGLRGGHEDGPFVLGLLAL